MHFITSSKLFPYTLVNKFTFTFFYMVYNGKTRRTSSNSLFQGFSVVPVFRGVPVFRCSGVPVFRCSGVFRGVPGCSGMFRCSGVRCSGVFRDVPVFLVLVHAVLNLIRLSKERCVTASWEMKEARIRRGKPH